MLTQKQKDYLETIPDNKVAHITLFNPDAQKTAYKIISEIESITPLKIAYFGSSKLGIAGENDIVLITGKGAEQSIIIGGQKMAWDDRQVVREELKNI